MNTKSGLPTLNSLRAACHFLEAAADELCYPDASEMFPMVGEAYFQVRGALPLIEQAIQQQERGQDEVMQKQLEIQSAQRAAVVDLRRLGDEDIERIVTQVYAVLNESIEKTVGVPRGRERRGYP